MSAYVRAYDLSIQYVNLECDPVGATWLSGLGLQKLFDPSQVLDEAVIFFFTLRRFRMSKNGRWVDGHKDVRSDGCAPRSSSQFI